MGDVCIVVVVNCNSCWGVQVSAAGIVCIWPMRLASRVSRQLCFLHSPCFVLPQ